MISNLFKDIPVTKIFGTAGAGKTTKLIEFLDLLFKQGVSPERSFHNLMKNSFPILKPFMQWAMLQARTKK